ncbi:recombinase family protein [Bradyrhizobium sp. 139]|uniref:recombinase family protein n=1 Tax=Bradyrhizobium sp. 139 TaxID=2782616 RepID=UPI001FFA519A|nr:recombinase family protein [Bradyrhizobium sp. 139]MCK1741384.1 recombinase family protein [Bradyrhizobium sp. 139]
MLHSVHHNKRVALYARFSSDLQKDRSIEDQFAELERTAKRFGLQADRRHYYADRGVSASSLFDRPGLTRELMGAAARREFETILVEATDRLSRDRADLFWLAKRFNFHNIILFTPAGEVSDMQLTFDGHSNEDFIRKLAVRVKRGHDGITREGKVAGSHCYGYDLVPGKPGERTINETEAAVIRRIFAEYASGASPRKIVAALRRDGIPSPSGKAVWNYQGILGSDKAATGAGLLHREIYRGKVVRNRAKSLKNPDTGKRLRRLADPDDVIVVEAPHLRIIDEGLWNAAHAVRRQRRVQMNPSGVVKPVLGRKPQLLSGIVKCATCSGGMTIVSSARGGQIGCSNARYRGTCDHTKLYDLGTITSEVIDKVDQELTNPEFLKARMKARALELAKAEREEGAERQAVQRQIDRLNVQIARLVDVLTEGDLPVPELKEKIKAKEAERVALKERQRLLGDANNVTGFPSACMAEFGKSIETLIALLKRNPDDPHCRLAMGNLIDCVLVHPTPKKAPYDLSLYCRVSAIGNLNLFPAQRSHDKIVAEEGVNPLFGTGHAVTSD